MQEGKTIQSVAKAMMLLDLLAGESAPMTLAEISQKTNWPKSTIHGLLSTMRDFSVIAQDEEGRYMLGVRLFEYGCTLSNSWTIIETAKPYIQHISYATGEAAFLSILDRGEIITLDRADNRSGLWISAEMGCRLPIHCTSQGKLFLAFMSPPEQKALLKHSHMEAYTEHTITSIDALQEELSQIREAGYAIENSEYKTGLRSVAAPIFDETGKIRYAIGVIGMSRQLEAEQFDSAIKIVTDTAKTITRTIS